MSDSEKKKETEEEKQKRIKEEQRELLKSFTEKAKQLRLMPRDEPDDWNE